MIHPWKLTWNLKIPSSKRRNIYKPPSIFGFWCCRFILGFNSVNLFGCYHRVIPPAPRILAKDPPPKNSSKLTKKEGMLASNTCIQTFREGFEVSNSWFNWRFDTQRSEAVSSSAKIIGASSPSLPSCPTSFLGCSAYSSTKGRGGEQLPGFFKGQFVDVKRTWKKRRMLNPGKITKQ